MPIEIKELHIKTVVDNSSQKKGGRPTTEPENMKVIVAQCVEQVMEIIQQKVER
jgi:hypothetical protein